MFYRLLLVSFTMIVASAASHARVVTINLSSLGSSDITEGLRSRLSSLTYSDKAIILMDQPGTFVLRGTVTGNCSVEMKRCFQGFYR